MDLSIPVQGAVVRHEQGGISIITVPDLLAAIREALFQYIHEEGLFDTIASFVTSTVILNVQGNYNLGCGCYTC